MLKSSSLQRHGLAPEGSTESREAAWLWGMTRVGEQMERGRKEGKGTVLVLQYPISHSSAHLRSICFPPAGSPRDARLGIMNGASAMAGFGKQSLEPLTCSS